MKVRAKVMGFYGGARRRPGSVFEFTGKTLGSWMEPVREGAPPPVGAEKQEPVALSELAAPLKAQDGEVAPESLADVAEADFLK